MDLRCLAELRKIDFEHELEIISWKVASNHDQIFIGCQNISTVITMVRRNQIVSIIIRVCLV